jgi:hypothetical protein
MWFSVPREVALDDLEVRVTLHRVCDDVESTTEMSTGAPPPPAVPAVAADEEHGGMSEVGAVHVALSSLAPDESTLLRLRVPLSDACGASGALSSDDAPATAAAGEIAATTPATAGAADALAVGDDSAQACSEGTLTLRVTYRPLHDSEHVPLDVYGFEVPLAHVVAFSDVCKSTARDGSMWLDRAHAPHHPCVPQPLCSCTEQHTARVWFARKHAATPGGGGCWWPTKAVAF